MFLIKLFSHILSALCLTLISLNNYGQANADTLFKEFNLATLEPLNPAGAGSIYQKGFYVRRLHPRKKNKSTLELIRVYKDSSTASRKARVVQAAYGRILAFDVLRTAGFEKVLIFGEHDFYYDSLLTRQDTIFFKEQSNDLVELTIVYPVVNDTLTIKYGSRNTRTDFLKKIYYRPALENSGDWFPDTNLDYTETYTLVKKDGFNELIKVETSKSSTPDYEYNSLKQRFEIAGLSLTWLALMRLYFESR